MAGKTVWARVKAKRRSPRKRKRCRRWTGWCDGTPCWCNKRTRHDQVRLRRPNRCGLSGVRLGQEQDPGEPSDVQVETCSQFRLLVNMRVVQDRTLLELSAASLAAKFAKTFNETNYFFCFYFMKFYLNIAGSSALGQWFLKTIFVNLGTRVFSWKKSGETADDW